MAMAAWRTAGSGGHPCRQILPLDYGYSLPLHNRNNRFIQYTFMLPLEVVASQCCCRHILNGKTPAENPLAGLNGYGGIRTVGSGSVAAVAFVQCWILNFVFVYSLVLVFHIHTWPSSILGLLHIKLL